MQKKEMILVGLNGNILEHQLNWEITMINLSGVMQDSEKRKPIRNMMMQKTTWELLNHTNAENVEQ
jgi:hypothetical protein